MKTDRIFVLLLVVLLPMSGCFDDAVGDSEGTTEQENNNGISSGESPVIYAEIWGILESDTEWKPPHTRAFYNSWYQSLVDDGDGTYSKQIFIEWDAFDIDGNISQMGLDYNHDGVIDIQLYSNNGVTSDQNNSAFTIPLEYGNTIHRYSELYNESKNNCGLIFQNKLVIIAIDDSGLISKNNLYSDAFGGLAEPYGHNSNIKPIQGYSIRSPFFAISPMAGFLNISQSDIDWVSGVNSNCMVLPSFTISDHPDILTNELNDSIATFTIVDKGDNYGVHDGSDGGYIYFKYFCIDQNGITREGDYPDMALINSRTGESPGSAYHDYQNGDIITFYENGWPSDDYCSNAVEFEVYVYIGGSQSQNTMFLKTSVN